MDRLQSKVESWIRNQRSKMRVSWPQLRWPWNDGGQQRKQLQEEYQRRRKQLHSLCHAVKAESVSDLQDILCAMVLAECVYKKPAAEMLRAANKFKADFGGQVVSLERVQPSLDHVPHRYLLAEAGDTLYASFIGTKQYKDVIADANILQGAIFHEDFIEDIDDNEVSEIGKTLPDKPSQLKVKPKLDQVKNEPKPAAHRGFLARAKGIPALELYRLAQKKNRKLVLCGHSLGGAVAALATLAILRVIASSSQQKENETVQVQCITFSQPPVGNAALKDYVHRKGWQHYFKTYCIPEDLVPRILSPAYFHHYNVQTSNDGETMSPSLMKHEDTSFKLRKSKPKEDSGEQLVLGLGPVQKSFWRISRLVPLESVWKQLDRFKRRPGLTGRTSSILDSSLTTAFDDAEAEPQSLEIQEGSEGISLTPLGDRDRESTHGNSHITGKGDNKNGDSGRWRRVPYLPSYVPFGQLYLLGSSSVESLSDSEYSKLTSVKSVLAELRERLQSHSMKSYRSRFQKIYELCMCVHPSPFSGIEQLPQFPHLQQWLGLAVAGTVELGHIVDPLVIRTATSVLPLGWSGTLGEKNVEPLKVDITGYGLHLCSLVQAQVNGTWCSTTVESLPPAPNYSSDHVAEPDLQKMRIIIGRPLRQPPKHRMVADSFMAGFPSPDSDPINLAHKYKVGSCEEKDTCANGLHDFFICCTSDFITASKDVCVRTRRVRLVGLEGAGKTSLFNAILGQSRKSIALNLEIVNSENDTQAGTRGGLCYLDTIGISLQELHSEVARFKDELWAGVRDLNKKIDLIVLVHNLSHKIPIYHQPDASKMQPALSLLLDEAKALGIPWVLAITNKFSVSAHQQKSAISDVVNAYQALPSMTEVINSSPYATPSSARSSDTWLANEKDPKGIMAAQKLILAPVNVVRMPFQKKSVVLPVDGVTSLCRLIHRVLKSHEEVSFQELASERLQLELAREQAMVAEARQDSQGKVNSLTAAAVGASLGAGLGLVLAVVMGAASALRKP